MFQKGLIVSCQALEDEPLHSPLIMSRMALAAKEGGAVGIRANSVPDILAIRETVSLPMIGIIKQVYPDSEVYITPTIEEVQALYKTGTEVIAVDATDRIRPYGVSLDEFYREVRRRYPGLMLMADCSSYDEAVHADQLGFDYIGTTMVGYTKESRMLKIEADDFALLRGIIADVHHPVIAEGHIDTPAKARRVLELGASAVVVGSAITRPQLITRKFTEEIEKIR